MEGRIEKIVDTEKTSASLYLPLEVPLTSENLTASDHIPVTWLSS